MFKIYKLPLLVVSILGYFIILFTFSGSVIPAYGQDNTHGIPSMGKGPYEVIMFSDYFCPPCRRIDTKAEPLLKELLATNKVKITFVDVPFNKATPIYAKYYLYSINANPDVNSVLPIRKILFDAAQDRHIQTEDALVVYLNEQKILWKTMDEKSIFLMLSALINENNVKNTPSCVIRYSDKDVKKFVGNEEIWDGLKQLKAFLTIGEK